MKVWSCSTFTGVWPTTTAAIVVADTRERATELLNKKLLDTPGLIPNAEPNDLELVETDEETVIILANGEY